MLSFLNVTGFHILFMFLSDVTAGQDPIEQSIFFYNLSPWITVYGPPSNETSLMAQVLP